MKSVIVYWSRYGNGKKVVECLAKRLQEQEEGVQIFKTDEVDPAALPEADRYIFSAPTEAFNIQKNMRKFMKRLEGMEGKKYGIINTHSMDRNWLNKMEKLLSKKNMVKIAEVDFQVGDGSQTGDGLMEGWEAKIESFAGKL
jgi:flavodoxin